MPRFSHVDLINRNPERFPVLLGLMRLREVHEDQALKAQGYWSAIASGRVIPTMAAAGAVGYYASGKLPIAKGHMGRRKFLQTLALGAGVVTAGRHADNSTTTRGLKAAEQALDAIRALPAFRKLPSSAQNQILPPLEAFESNPRSKAVVAALRKPRGAAIKTARETAVNTATMAAPLALDFIDYAEPNEPGMGRRAFLSLATLQATGGIMAAANNKQAAARLLELPDRVATELEDLHALAKRTALR